MLAASNTSHAGGQMTTSFLEKALSWSNGLYIAAVVIAALSTFAIYFFASQLSAAKDADLQNFQTESRFAIAEANGRAAIASLDAAKANERTQALEVEAAKQRERAAKAEAQLLELQERFQDRHMSATVRSAFVKELRAAPKGKIEIYCSGTSLEPCAFAEEILGALKDAQWTILNFFPGIVEVGSPTVGLSLEVLKDGETPIFAAPLIIALIKAGFPTPMQSTKRVPDGAVSLWIGIKPPLNKK